MEQIGSLDDLLSATETDYANVTIDGKTWRIGSLTGEEFATWQEVRDSGPEARKRGSALLILRSLVDKDGKRIGDESKADLVKKLKLKVSEALLKAIFKLNGIQQPEATKNG